MASAQPKQPVTETAWAEKLWTPLILVGAGLPAMGSAQSTVMLTDPPPSLASQLPQVVVAVRGAHRP